MQSEALAVRFELLAVLIRGDDEASSLLFGKHLRVKHILVQRRAEVRGLQSLELVDLAEVLDEKHVGLVQLNKLIRISILHIYCFFYDLFAIMWHEELEDLLPFTFSDVDHVILIYLLIFTFKHSFDQN